MGSTDQAEKLMHEMAKQAVWMEQMANQGKDLKALEERILRLETDQVLRDAQGVYTGAGRG